MTFTLADTANTDSCKSNLTFRGLTEDLESRTAFQYVASVGDKNVYRIFAGGDHSWVVIDDIIPRKANFRPPSPVPNYSASGKPEKSKSAQREVYQSKSRNFEVSLTVQSSFGATDTTLCHRFINFETQDV